jgi:hypothetical protein
MVTMLGCVSLAQAAASKKKRRTNCCREPWISVRTTLIATGRPSGTCVATYTRPMPPAASSRSIW